MPNDVITEAVCYRLRLPLASPYRWRGGLIEHFDAVLVVVTTDDGCTGIGEGTPVDGYSFESVADVWAYSVRLVGGLRGRSASDVLRETIGDVTRYPFGCAAVRGALEAVVADTDAGPSSVAVPVVGTVRPVAGLSEVEAALQLVEQGYTILKVKVGNDVERDMERLDRLQRHVQGARLRLDANQGYRRTEAERFLKSLDPNRVELVEQPLPREGWEDQGRLHACTEIPLMLDESIWTDEDIVRAAQVADVVKLKVMKSGGADVARRHAAVAADHGLEVVIGNGVATEIDALAEARVHVDAGLRMAGEFNGFAKQADGLVLRPPRIRGGMLESDAFDARLDLDSVVLKRHAVEESRCS